MELNVCSQLKRGIGEFCGVVGLSVAISAGKAEAMLMAANCPQYVNEK